MFSYISLISQLMKLYIHIYIFEQTIELPACLYHFHVNDNLFSNELTILILSGQDPPLSRQSNSILLDLVTLSGNCILKQSSLNHWENIPFTNYQMPLNTQF